MSANTLEQILGGIVKPSEVNQIINALITEFVGRNSSGAPESGQSLGNVLVPWGPAYLTSIILNGLPVDESLVTGIANQIKSGQERSTSTLADYIRANGSANSVEIQGGTTSLITSINGSEVITAADLAITGLTVAPGSNNTCLVDDASLIDQESSKFIGEDGTSLTIGTVGSEISDRTGMIIALKGATEIMYGVLKDATTFHQAYRGFFLDSSGDPIKREVLSDSDTLTLMELGWIFLQNNGSTLDVSYLTPIISFDEPTLDLHGDALADGQYWFDITNQEWKRHNGAAFVSINRILIGSCVVDATNCIGSRSIDFNKAFDDLIISELEVVSNTIVGALQNRTSISVNGQSIQVQYSPLNWTMPGDLESGESESSSQDYYVYLSDKGEQKLSTIKYYDRPDLKGLYHPYNSWRCIGVVTNNGSSNFSVVRDYHGRTKQEDLTNKTILDPVDAIKDFGGITASGLRFKSIALGIWNMNSSNSPVGSVNHNLGDPTRIKMHDIIILNDAGTISYTSMVKQTANGSTPQVWVRAFGTNSITLWRDSSGDFGTSTDFNGAGNRGYITISYS